MTYRSRYMARPEWIAVLDLLIADDSNPRGIAFQTGKLRTDLISLNKSLGGIPDTGIDALHETILALDATLDFHPGSLALGETLAALRQSSAKLSDLIGLHFFSHSDAASRVIA